MQTGQQVCHLAALVPVRLRELDIIDQQSVQHKLSQLYRCGSSLGGGHFLAGLASTPDCASVTMSLGSGSKMG